MPRLLPLLSGAATGIVLVQQRRQRVRAERLAAALFETLLRAIDADDAETGQHVRRVARYALTLADAAGLDERAMRSVERVALFHDIGKIHGAVSDLVHDSSALTAEERRAVATHPARGAEALEPLDDFYPELSEGVIAHHERWDGSGYPRGLSGEAIPITARIVALADAFDAITYGRRYQEARDAADAAQAIEAGRGKQFDPDLTDLFLSPPVFDRLMQWLRAPSPPRPRPMKRNGHVDGAPDVNFRWRTVTRDR
jgi:HD-GYP domain-containing protein (c-di-GMP phosphodiesterase class II)